MKALTKFIARLLPLVALLPLVTPLPAAPAPGKAAQLRALLKLPALGFTMGVGAGVLDDEMLLGSDDEYARRLAKLESAATAEREDPARLMERGRLLEKLKRNDEAAQIYTNATRALRRRAEARPQDAGAWCDLALAVVETSEGTPAALPLARKATGLAPRDWRTWDTVGRILLRVSPFREATQPGEATPTDLAGLARALARTVEQAVDRMQLTADEVRADQERKDEAIRVFTRAIELAPDRWEPYAHRAEAHAFRDAIKMMSESFKGRPDISTMTAMLSKPIVRADLHRAAERAGPEAQVIARAAFFEVFNLVLQNSDSGPNLDDLNSRLHGSARENYEARLTQLEALADGPDRLKAGAAAHYRGSLAILTGAGQMEAIVWLKRAVELDPDRDRAWDALIVMAGTSGMKSEVIASAERRLKHRDTPLNRLWLAKALEMNDQLDRAEEYLRAALRQNPQHFKCALGLAALLLRSNQPERDQEAEPLLHQCEARVSGREEIAGEAPLTDEEKAQFYLTASIHGAVKGEPLADVRKLLDHAIKLAPDLARAKEAREIVAVGERLDP